MKIAGIIAEYNPFHSGHQYQIEELRRQGATHVVAVMSGHIVQRGEPAVASKWVRARTALQNGVDLVIELPSLWANTSAERFGQAGVALLHALGCVDWLAFGSETGDLKLLQCTAEACADPEVDAKLAEYLREGLSYPVARERAVSEKYGESISGVLRNPNDILAVEYLKALCRLEAPMQPIVIPRKGVAHDADGIAGGFASGSYLRQLIRQGRLEEIAPFVPENALEIYLEEAERGRLPSDMMRLERAVLLRLRELDIAAWEVLPDVSEGLAERLYAAAQQARGATEFLQRAKTKRYTLARLRRIAMAALLGVKKEDLFTAHSCIRVLGLNAHGAEILRKAKETSRLPVESRFPEVERLAPRMAEIECRAADWFSLSLPKPFAGKLDYTQEISKPE